MDREGRPIEREGAEPGEDRQQVELFLPHLGPGETEWRIVDEIEYVETVGLKPGGELFGEFLGGEVPGHGRSSKRITNHNIVLSKWCLSQGDTGVTVSNVESVRIEPQLILSDVDDCPVEFEHRVGAAGMGGGYVAGKGEAAAADVAASIGSGPVARAAMARRS